MDPVETARFGMVDLSILQYILIGLAALAAGMVNALAGGGTLITFPVLTAVGIPAVIANVTNTVALCPGYLGATFAQMKELRSQKQRLWLYLPAGALGGILGGLLLVNTSEKVFREIVPFLILLASGLLAVSDPLRAFLIRRMGKSGSAAASLAAWGVLPVALAGIYGGYFGAGLSVIVLAVLGLMVSDNLTNLNALKQAIAFSVNITAAIFFVFTGKVFWPAALVMAGFALLGGVLGGRLAGKIKPATLRWMVVGIGTLVAILYLIRG
jgi:uncharacterized membrane protein YfcA